jgi:proteic killer suppression protein
LTERFACVTIYVTLEDIGELPLGESMDIYVNDNKLRRAFENESICRREYGTDMAKKIKLRLAALRAAGSMADFWPPKSGPERCHELIGDRAGTFSVDLKQPYRLLFKPREVTPSPDHSRKAADAPDEQTRWKSITGIDILEIEDTHG